MARTFSNLKTRVGNNVQDTSSGTATLIGYWLNEGYQDAWARCMWYDLIDNDYTFESIVDQAEYDLPADFGEEIFMANIAQGYRLNRMTQQQWWTERTGAYQDDTIDSGTSSRYIILEDESKFKLDPPPDTAETYAMPYKATVSDMSADSDVSSISNLDNFLIMYATGQTYAYKNQFAKADWYLNRSEFELRKRINQEKSKFNQRYQFVPSQRMRGGIHRLTGDTSYDTI